VLYAALHLLGLLCFSFIAARRLAPLVRAERDPRFDHPVRRLGLVLQYWLGQWRQPRYRFAGAIHLLIFAGFILLALRASTVLVQGVSAGFVLPGFSGALGRAYELVVDYAGTVVFVCMIVGIARRAVFRPARYAVPERFQGNYGKWRPADAIFLLSLIALLMAADAAFEASKAAAELREGLSGGMAAVWSMRWALTHALSGASASALSALHHGAYFVHEAAFFFLLCYRPFGVQFHVETSLFSIFFAKLDRSRLKPVRWGVSEDRLDDVKSFGVKTFQDFTWKHILDFYSCADCGRCADQCPANAAGRPLAPRFFTIKARDYAFRHYPVFGKAGNGSPLIGGVYSEDEIWSCTPCGACEAECPLLIEYIDKIVDLRRGMVDDGRVPQSLQKPLKALESRGNPYGKMDRKRGEWANSAELKETCEVKTVGRGNSADTLYFVDSVTSYDERIQAIGRATARILSRAGVDFGILGAAERDSGHEVRRFGEELLFMALRDRNTEAIKASGARRIVTADPHAFNALKHDYIDMPPVEHISQVIARKVAGGELEFAPLEDSGSVYAYHDPCYLGRHNGVFDEPRAVLDAIPGLRRVEMRRSRDRSFCCGGGGLALFYEPKEEQRIGVLRVRMAAEAGANVIVTACPFCMVNVEDAIKVAGLEGKMTAIDLTELVDRQIVRERPASGVQAEPIAV
jgi:Fe-S oxidoreductase